VHYILERKRERKERRENNRERQRKREENQERAWRKREGVVALLLTHRGRSQGPHGLSGAQAWPRTRPRGAGLPLAGANQQREEGR